MTREQAIELVQTNWWLTKSDDEIVRFQLFERLLCMDFGRFHQAVEKVLGRPVYTHEFADANSLRAEYLGEKKAPTLEEIINLIPEAKRILVVAP
jgi:hypothetical protein